MQFDLPYIRQADENPFTVEESHFADAKYYQKKKENEPQPHEVQEEHKVLEKVVAAPLNGFVALVNGQKVEHATMRQKTYDILVKAGYDPTEDKSMGQFPHEVTGDKVHGLKETQKMLQRKGYVVGSPSAGLGYTPQPPLRILIKRVTTTTYLS
ncbi:hypothetical protein LIER_12908 [Lithospermum erythrorhizon]|uniref:Uncharacterized protein n=1 Tax=Lithospermum erythrorhizon TaxID=34254 RepID=A0AAV3PTR2_LITER